MPESAGGCQNWGGGGATVSGGVSRIGMRSFGYGFFYGNQHPIYSLD